MLEDFFGDTVNVDDWLKDGQSHIPTDALKPVLEGMVDAAISGGMDAEDAIQMAWGYFNNGGDVDFMLPAFNDMVSDWEIPGLDFEKGGWDIGYDEESGDVVINHDFPSVDIDLPDLDVDITNPCEEGQILDKMGVCQWPDLPDITNPCEEGQILDELGVCQWPDLPDIENPCEEGQILDELGVC